MAFTRAQIIEIANRRTEKRGEPALDMESEFLTSLQEVCLEKRWWWRRKILAFSLTAGKAQYQLLDSQDVNALDFQQVSKNGFKVFATSGPSLPIATGRRGCTYTCPVPVFDGDEQETILATQAQYPFDVPVRYFILGDGSTLTVDPVPNAAYPASLAYWAVPQIDAGSQDETIPLIPVALYSLLIKRLELNIERYCVGEESAKFQVVAKQYGQLLDKAQLYTHFAEGEVNEWRSRDCNDAVQST